MARLWRDIRLAFRVLRKTPAITAVALLSLALGIGANTAIFSLLNAVLLRPLPVPHPEQLVSLATTIFDSGRDENFSWPMVQELTRQQQIFSDLFYWEGGGVSNYEVDGAHYTATHAQASPTYYKAMRVQPLLGRFIAPEDFAAGDAPSQAVAVISYRVWRSWFRASSQVIGKSLRVGRHLYSVIGVEPEGFSDLIPDGGSDVTVPFFAPGTANDKDPRMLRYDIFARLRPGDSLPQARAALLTLWPHIQEASLPSGYAGEAKSRFFARKIKLESAATGSSWIRNRFAYPLQILMTIVAAVLLIACLNIANLTLAKAESQRQQAGIQAALGATVWDLIKPALFESLMLSSTGALLGLMLSYWASHFLINIAWTGFFATAIDPSPDLKVLGFTATVAIATGLLFGIVPALYAARIDPIEALKQQSRSVKSGANLFGKGLLVMQVALSLVLILGALLFGRTLSALHNADVGYRRDHLLTLVLFPQSGSALPQDQIAYYQNLAEQVRRVPGVEGVSYSYWGPADQTEYFADSIFGTLSGPPSKALGENVSPGFFALMSMHMLQGRDLRWSDAKRDVVVISQSLAEKLFPNRSAVGHIIYRGPHAHTDPYTIVGVVNSASLWKVESAHPLAYYRLYEPGPNWGEPIMDVRTTVDPQTLKTAIEAVVRNQGHHYSLRTQTVDERLDSFLTIQRLTALLSEFFGGVALLIACVGLYGLMSYHVTRRTTELGIRSALGANRGNLLRMVLYEALLLAATGCLLGILGSIAASRYVKTLLFGVSSNDPATLLVGTLLMLAVATAAAFIPARRAAQVDPMTALRAE